MGGERMAKRSSFGSMVRKRLSDITNSQSQPKPSSQEEKPKQIPPSVEDYINQLIKLQNWNLAQSNSQMLAEVNLGRDRVKALQHELVCKEALLKVKNLENKGKVNINCQNSGSQAAEETMPKANDDDKPSNRDRRRNARSQSMGPSTKSQRGADKEKTENKRRCLRRQSARFKSQEQELSSENLFEIEDVKFADANHQLDEDTPMHEADGATPLNSSINIKEETQTFQRPSLGRPLRRAVEKVQSYKEIPLNVKMRRN
ncbi:hypothetical protein COLO4_11106 [Corchorus olitorius]|uniref:Shugoshin C-terminal domain-containing protein n=1 Tax=Corchorus olitorius TaxID=93759 RepID=A0A1R3K5R3_9ROSI|nr:hypothetical protein COLO4_11106 [Corchorus olitorius]